MATEADETESYNKFKKAQFDLDFGEDISKQFFLDYFNNEGIEKPATQTIYDSINKENSDHLTTKEFFEWQREQCTKRTIQELLASAQNIENNHIQWSKPREEEWSKSYSMKFDLYEDEENIADINMTNVNDEKTDETETIYVESPKQIQVALSIDPQPLKTSISADFAGFIDAHSPTKKSPSKNKNIGIGQVNFTHSHSQNRVDMFLSDDDSDIEVEAETADEIKAENQFRCMECTCYLIFLILFTGMAIFSIGSGDSNYTATTAIRKPAINVGEFIGWNDISEKTFDDISTAEDIYHYLRQILVPFLMSDGKYVNGSNIYYIQHHAVLLGGIRMRQIRQKALQCNDVSHFNDSDCYEQDEIDRDVVHFYNALDDNITYEYVDSSVLLDQRYQGKFNSYPGGGYIHDLPLDLSESLDIIDMLEEFDWIDAATLCLTVDFTMYNPSKSLHTVARLIFEMPTSGIFAMDEIKTWKFDRYSGETTGFVLFVIHVIFMMFVCVISGIFIIDIYRNYCDERKAKSFWTQWRIMDIMILFIFYVTIALFIHNESYQKALIDIYRYQEPYQSFRRLQALSLMEAYCFAINGFLLWVKLFKYLAFHPKFKFLFYMLQRGLQDIVMFIVILFVFYLAFALSGFLIFSSDVAAYRSYGLSVVSMNLYMLTEMNYSDLMASSRMFGSFYYFSWLIWMTFILMNVFIAILIDSYSKTQVEIELDGANAIRFNVFEKGREYAKKLKFAQLMSRFEAIDEDGDDNVDVGEIAKALKISHEDAKRVMIKYDNDGNGVLDRKEFEKLKQKLVRDQMEQKPEYRQLKKHENLKEQFDDMKDLMNAMLQIDPSGRRALKATQGLKRN